MNTANSISHFHLMKYLGAEKGDVKSLEKDINKLIIENLTSLRKSLKTKIKDGTWHNGIREVYTNNWGASELLLTEEYIKLIDKQIKKLKPNNLYA